MGGGATLRYVPYVGYLSHLCWGYIVQYIPHRFHASPIDGITLCNVPHVGVGCAPSKQ
jgi:hypothetical protein